MVRWTTFSKGLARIISACWHEYNGRGSPPLHTCKSTKLPAERHEGYSGLVRASACLCSCATRRFVRPGPDMRHLCRSPEMIPRKHDSITLQHLRAFPVPGVCFKLSIDLVEAEKIENPSKKAWHVHRKTRLRAAFFRAKSIAAQHAVGCPCRSPGTPGKSRWRWTLQREWGGSGSWPIMPFPPNRWIRMQVNKIACDGFPFRCDLVHPPPQSSIPIPRSTSPIQ